MDSAPTVQLQSLLDRLRQGDPAAKREFLEQVCDRLRRLAAKILFGSFPRLQSRHDVDSVVHETWLRLVQALEKSEPPTVADFFRLAAHKIRQVLLDMTERQRKIDQRETLLGQSGSPAKAKAGKSGRKDEDTTVLEKILSDALGLNVEVAHKGPGGQVIIRYSSLEQLDEIARRLKRAR